MVEVNKILMLTEAKMNDPKDAYAEYTCSWNEAAYNDAYCGEWRSGLHFATELFWTSFDVSDKLLEWINYEKYRAKIFEDEYFSIKACEGAVWVFKK